LRRCALAAGVVVTLVVLVGCSGSSSRGTHARGPSGIRGTELPAFGCGAKADGTALMVAPADVIELRVCPVVAPSPFNRPPQPITLARGSTRFEALVSALSLPDGERAAGVMCPEYAELLQPVLARTESTALLVHLPVDGCDHTLAPVSAALGAVINGTSATAPSGGTM